MEATFTVNDVHEARLREEEGVFSEYTPLGQIEAVDCEAGLDAVSDAVNATERAVRVSIPEELFTY